jgi:hypothetical protein
MPSVFARTLGDPFELFRLVVVVFSLAELGGIAAELRAGYLRWHENLRRFGGAFLLHDLLRATVRLQVYRVVLKPRGWDEVRILVVQAAAAACGAATWFV